MKISKYKQQIIEEYESNKRVKILNIFYGKTAFNNAKYLLFDINGENSNKWSNIWDNYEKNTCVLIIYEYILKVNKEIRITLIIGRENTKNFSVVGEKFPYNKGLDILSDFI